MLCPCGWKMEVKDEKLICSMCGAEMFEFWINDQPLTAEAFNAIMILEDARKLGVTAKGSPDLLARLSLE